MKTEEGALKDFVKHELKKLNAYFFMPVQMGYGATTLDFLCCVKGYFLAIETKASGKKPTPRQYLVLDQINITADGHAFWCDSKEMFLAEMRLHGFISTQNSCAPVRSTEE